MHSKVKITGDNGIKKNIWIWNHYATNTFKDQGGRHYWLAENLIKNGYNATVFCASTIHTSLENIDTGKKKYILDTVNSIPYVFIKTPLYAGNGLQRIKNMVAFYLNLFPVTREYAKCYGKPDIILASSVHPLTLVAGIKIARKFGIPCICEVRDLWPESIVASGFLKKNSIVYKILHQGEKWIYKNADSLVMTCEGNKDYIIEQGWEKDVPLEKIHYICNGIMLDAFDKNSEENPVIDSDLDDPRYKNIVYAGAVRKANNIGMIIDAAKIIQDKGIEGIRFLIYGNGDEVEPLQRRCKAEHIHNVIFKGHVAKKYIPSIVKKAYINILHANSIFYKYGQSQNKMFEYLAAGRCIIQTYQAAYGICDKYHCGIVLPDQNSEEIAKTAIMLFYDEEKCNTMGKNARQASYEFDFKKLTEKLISIIENI